VDGAALERNFKRMQATVHPDKWGTSSSSLQAASASASAQLNVAYAILRQPASRAQYLLQLHGMDALGETAGSAQVEPALLMEILEARELLTEADTSAATVTALRDDTVASIGRTLAQLEQAFDRNDLPAAARAAVQLQYYTKLAAEAREWLSRLALGQQPRS
jgi:molecular chaperone HscB